MGYIKLQNRGKIGSGKTGFFADDSDRLLDDRNRNSKLIGNLLIGKTEGGEFGNLSLLGGKRGQNRLSANLTREL